MSVAHLLGSAGDGGAETYFSSLAAALDRDGLEQAFAIRGHDRREAELKALRRPVTVLPFGRPLDLLTRPLAARFLKRTGATVAVAWMNRAALFTPRGPWARFGRLGGYYNLKYYRGMDMLVGNTQDICRWMAAEGWPESKIRYIPNFAAAGPGEAVDRAGLDTPEGAPLLLSMGRLHPVKAHDVALKALALLPEAYLWIAGSGPLESKLKGLARDLEVEARVRFLGWRSDAPALYRAADICVFPSRFEPLGNTVIQAWAHGVPVVAASSQGPAGLIRDWEDGVLTPIDDADALAETVRTLIADPARRAALAAKGAARVADEFSEGAVTAQWRDLFRTMGAA
jgi:glycosyltransferase involved in cell wall biosynthesis